MPEPATLIALLSGPDQPGLVARVSGWIFEKGGNILHADQHRDMEAGVFFQRVEWVPNPSAPLSPALASEAAAFRQFAASLGMTARVASSAYRPKVAIFVSHADHCFHDLALRWRAGEFEADLVAVISNHCRHCGGSPPATGLPTTICRWTPGEPGSRRGGEAARLLRYAGVELVILARYMQVLSAGFLASFGQPVINIHHSFLPAFAGGRPYNQAHERGVKLIGATAHYATAELDDGPIIQQDVVRVTHRHSVADLVRKGRDLEKSVLAQAVRWHLQSRVLVYGRKTVVFD